MIIEFTPGLDKEDIYANGNELVHIMGVDYDKSGNRVTSWPDSEKKHIVSFGNPVLVTDNYRISRLDPVLRDTTFALFASAKRTTVYDSTSLMFEQRKFPSVWGPSIDTLLLCRSLKYLKDNDILEDIRTAAEIGSGSGFLSKYALEKNPQIKKMMLVDINENAKRCADESISDARMRTAVSGGLKYLAGKRFDLVICNPPYIPRAATVENNHYEGIGLLSGLITDAPNYLTSNGMLLLNVSSLCDNKALSLIKDQNLNYEKVDRLDVPLKVFNVLNNSSWMEFLSRHSMKKDNHDGYDYWQTLNIYRISRKS